MPPSDKLLSERMREAAEWLRRHPGLNPDQRRTTDAGMVGFAAEVAALESALAQRTEALSKYGRHLSACPCIGDVLFGCTCGFSAALTGERT